MTGKIPPCHVLAARCYDPDLNLPRPNYFADLGEHMVNQCIPFALARASGSDGNTHSQALDMLLEVIVRTLFMLTKSFSLKLLIQLLTIE